MESGKWWETGDRRSVVKLDVRVWGGDFLGVCCKMVCGLVFFV